jgi:hypothetical protein
MLWFDKSEEERESSETVHTISSSESSEDVGKDWEDMVDERERYETMSKEEEVAVKVGEAGRFEVEVVEVGIELRKHWGINQAI